MQNKPDFFIDENALFLGNCKKHKRNLFKRPVHNESFLFADTLCDSIQNPVDSACNVLACLFSFFCELTIAASYLSERSYDRYSFTAEAILLRAVKSSLDKALINSL